jgi:hypothetical protein
MHPGAVLQHLEYTKSDHRPILLDTDYQHVAVNQGKKSKKIEARWMREKGFREMVENTWSEASLAIPVGNVLTKLGQLHGAMHAWDASVVQKPKKELRKAQQELDKALSGPMIDENDAKAKEMALIIELLLEHEEIYWL